MSYIFFSFQTVSTVIKDCHLTGLQLPPFNCNSVGSCGSMSNPTLSCVFDNSSSSFASVVGVAFTVVSSESSDERSLLFGDIEKDFVRDLD